MIAGKMVGQEKPTTMAARAPISHPIRANFNGRGIDIVVSSIYMNLLILIWLIYKHNNITADVMAPAAETVTCQIEFK